MCVGTQKSKHAFKIATVANWIALNRIELNWIGLAWLEFKHRVNIRRIFPLSASFQRFCFAHLFFGFFSHLLFLLFLIFYGFFLLLFLHWFVAIVDSHPSNQKKAWQRARKRRSRNRENDNARNSQRKKSKQISKTK